MTVKNVDVIIVGMDTGGLIAGALLVKRGMSALVCDLQGAADKQAGPGAAPARIHGLLTGFGNEEPFQDVFLELGVPFLQKKQFRLADPAFQVVMPNHRIDIRQDRRSLLAVLAKEFPQDRSRLEEFLQDMDALDRSTRAFLAQVPPTRSGSLTDRLRPWRKRPEFLKTVNPSPRASFSEVLDEYELSGAGRTFLEATAGMLSDLKNGTLPLVHAARAIGYTNRKLYRTEGITNLLLQICKERIASLRGRFCGAEEISEMAPERGGQILVRFKGLPDAYKTRYVIWNTDPTGLMDFIPKKIKGGIYSRRRKKNGLRAPIFPLFLRVSERVLPVGMMEDVAFVPDASLPALGENLLAVTVFPPESPETDERVIRVGCRPDPDRPLNEKGLIELCDKMQIHLQELIPFLDRYVVSEMKTESVKAFLSDRYAHTPAWSDPEDVLGISGFPAELPQDEILYSGREMLPGLGMEGHAITGLWCAELIGQRQLR